MTELRTKIIACQTVGEELGSLLPDHFEMEVLEYGLHNIPEELHARLQTAIDRTSPEYGTILIGYGLCANAVIGIRSRTFRLVIPRADDCITLFLGSREAYEQQFRQAPGTFYLTRGWIECGEDPYTEYCTLRDTYGPDKAYRITKKYIANYTRLALITSEHYDSGVYRKYAKMVADRFNLMYEEIPGSDEFLKNLVQAKWEENFVIVPPGEEVRYEMFYQLED
ncbi:MAG: DUF1638 domain-containing protein [Anaerolineales bacterium]|nr:DUF1638 domain-containing protein [Anaerolineales bacterium]